MVGPRLPPPLQVIFTYDVAFKASNIRWASRWDTYLLATDDQVHWFSIINSLMIVLFLRWDLLAGSASARACCWPADLSGLHLRLASQMRARSPFPCGLPNPTAPTFVNSGMVAMIMMRTLHRDISKYNQLETAEEAQEETGWKLVHGDVFRPPPSGSWLAVLVGTGVQLFGMTLVTMLFATLGFLSPANRGGLMTAVLLLFVFMGSFAGYFSARLYKTFKVRCVFCVSGGFVVLPMLRCMHPRPLPSSCCPI